MMYEDSNSSCEESLRVAIYYRSFTKFEMLCSRSS